MRHLRSLSTAAALLLFNATTALAHGGHAVPAGIPATDHLHLTGGLMVPGLTLLTLVLTGVIAATLLRSRGRQPDPERTGKARGNNRRHH